jgi:FAD/FMN-containing dehydrogenase
MKSDSSTQPSDMPNVVLPGDEAYESARLSWNLAADQRPAAVCIASSVDEVAAAIRYAGGRNLRIAPQTTGHMAMALEPLDRALLLKPVFDGPRVEVDREALTARIRGGATWDDVVSEVSAAGLTVMHGSSPSVSPFGYLLGGGLSFYARAHGFAANRVRSLEIVTADGEIRRADPEDHPDLFWALRGAGGRFGVVTEIEIELLPLNEVFAGISFWPVSEAAELLGIWGEWTKSAPDSVTSTFRILRLPPLEEIPEPIRGVPVACVDAVALEDEAGAALAGLFEDCADPLMGGWGRQPSAAVARLHGDPEDPLPGIGDAILLSELDADAENRFIAAAGAESGSSLVVAEIRQLGGSTGSPDDGSGVLSHLDAGYMLFGTGVAFDPASSKRSEEDLDRLLAALEPFRADRRLYGFAERNCSLEDCFGPESAARLEEIRDRYDPGHVFIAPHQAAGG